MPLWAIMAIPGQKKARHNSIPQSPHHGLNRNGLPSPEYIPGTEPGEIKGD